jgi:hypothetical protein
MIWRRRAVAAWVLFALSTFFVIGAQVQAFHQRLREVLAGRFSGYLARALSLRA